MISRRQHAPSPSSRVIPAPVPAAAQVNQPELGRPDQGLSLAQLEQLFPVGHRIQGACNFVIHDKEKTPIMEVLEADFKHWFNMVRLDEQSVQISYSDVDAGLPVFQHWPKYEINFDRGFAHIKCLANNTFPGSDTKQVNLDICFANPDQAADFAKFYEFGKLLGGYTGVRFGRRD